MDQAILQHFDSQVGHWASSLEHPGYQRRFEAVAKMVEGQQSCVLDIGCGPSLYASLFTPNIYIGIDISQEMVKKALELHPRHWFRTGHAERFSFPNGSFGLVLSIAVLEYLPNPVLHFKGIHRVLAPGGRAIIAVRNGYERFREWDKKLLRLLGKPVVEKNFEHKAYTLEELPLEGFHVRRVQFLHMILIPPIIDKRLHLNWIFEHCPWWRK